MRAVAIVIALLAATACAATQAMSSEESLALRRAAISWLECEECTNGELAALVKFGEKAVPTLGAALARGPSAATLEEVRMHLEDTYRNLVEYARTHSEVKVGLSEEAYVKLYLENFQAKYAVRAAQGLAALGGPAARKYLDAAAKRTWRKDVNAAILKAAR
jgi:hypothetical protein